MQRDELHVTAELALIDLDDDRLAAFEQHVSELLDHFSIMASFDVTGLAATTHALNRDNRLRADEVEADSERADLILDQATDLEDRFISIPNVL